MSTSAEMFQRLRAAEDVGMRNTLGLNAHEKECALRYVHINDSITRMTNILLWLGATVLAGMAGILVKLQFFPHSP